MRLIDADLAKEMIVSHANEFSDVLNRREKALLIGGGTSCIDKCPTIEAEPVKRGEWESRSETMPRLIDADAFLDKVLKQYTEHEKNGKLMFSACEIKQAIADMVTDAPTIEAEPVKHAQWIERSDKGVISMTHPYECSRCGRVEMEKESYCNCGAKMDGGADRET